MRLLLHTFLCVVALATVSCNRQQSNVVASNVSVQASPTQQTVESLISSLSSPDDSTRSADELINIGRQSAAQREVVIHRLLKAAESQDDLRTGKCFILKNVDYWDGVTKVFAQLKATEAIDLLITTVACGNGYSGSLGREPSMFALIDLGRVAVPKLSKALKSERDEYVRLHLRQCLDMIKWYERHPQ